MQRVEPSRQTALRERAGLSRRRLLDVGVAFLGLAVTSPLFLLLAVINRVLTGSVLFSQVRVGQDLQPFVILKFQTMRNGGLPESTVTVEHDPRITGFGRILRFFKLDELPQLINILRGEMSLVGPRPLTPNEIEAVPRHLAAVVYRVRPGLTGISSIAFADEERLLAATADPHRAYFEEILPRKIALELAYVQRRTWLTDLILVLFTPFAPFFPGLRGRLLLNLVPDWAALSARDRSTSRSDRRAVS